MSNYSEQEIKYFLNIAGLTGSDLQEHLRLFPRFREWFETYKNEPHKL